MPVKFQSDTMIITSNLTASKHHEICQREVLPISEQMPSCGVTNDIGVNLSWYSRLGIADSGTIN